MKKSRNGNFTVYEENDICALDEYSETLAEELEKEKEEQDNKIKTNTDNVELLKQENEILKETINNVIPSVGDSGENVTLNGTAEARFKKLEIQGNSWQETREGYNRLNNTATSKTVNGLNFTVNKDKSVTVNGTAESNTTFILAENIVLETGTYYLSGDNSGSIDTHNITLAGAVSCYNVERSFSITEEKTYASAFINIKAGITVENLKFYPMLSKESGKPYEQYGAMPSTEFKSPIRNVGDNVNVFDGELELGTLDASGNLVANANSVRSKNYNKIKANTTYTLSNNKNYTEAVYIYNASKEVVASFFDKTLQTFTTPSTAEYIKFRSSAGNSENDLTVKFKLEKGTKATSYSQYACGNVNFKITNGLENTDTNYKEQSFTFPLTEGQKLMKGDYLAEDRIHHKRKQRIFNGKESWFFTSNCVYTNVIINLVKKPTSNSEVADIKCNIYLKDTLANCYNNVNNKRIAINTQGFIYVYDTDFTSADEWKAYLAEQYANGTPVAIEYPLAEEEIEPYTEEQQEVRNQIKKAKSYLDTTHIISEDEINPIFDAEALRNLNVLFSEVIT